MPLFSPRPESLFLPSAEGFLSGLKLPSAPKCSTHSYKTGIPVKHSNKSNLMKALSSRCEYPAKLTFTGLVWRPNGSSLVRMKAGNVCGSQHGGGNGGISESVRNFPGGLYPPAQCPPSPISDVAPVHRAWLAAMLLWKGHSSWSRRVTVTCFTVLQRLSPQLLLPALQFRETEDLRVGGPTLEIKAHPSHFTE